MGNYVNYKEELHKDIAMTFNVSDHLKGLSVPELKNECKADQSPFAVGCINLTGNVNIGTIIRTASLYGAEKVIIFGRKQFDARGLVGADKYIDIEFVPSVIEGTMELDVFTIVETIRYSGYVPVMVEQGGKPLGSFDWHSVCDNHKPFLLLGNENRGIDPVLVNTLLSEIPESRIVSILQKGVLRSLT